MPGPAWVSGPRAGRRFVAAPPRRARVCRFRIVGALPPRAQDSTRDNELRCEQVGSAQFVQQSAVIVAGAALKTAILASVCDPGADDRIQNVLSKRCIRAEDYVPRRGVRRSGA